MNFNMILVIAAAIFAQPAEAQQSSVTPPQISCELHVFPAGHFDIEIEKWTEILGAGIVSGSLDEAIMSRNLGSRLKSALATDVQVQRLEQLRMLERLGFAPETAVVPHDPLLGDGNVRQNPALKDQALRAAAAEKAGTRLTSSENPCYAELIVSSVRLRKSVLQSPKMAVFFWLRDFRKVGGKPLIIKGFQDAPLARLSGTAGVGDEDAKAFVGAFEAAFQSWVATVKL